MSSEWSSIVNPLSLKVTLLATLRPSRTHNLKGLEATLVGAMSRIRWIIREGVLPDNWLGKLVRRKPRMVAAVALANKMARIIWAIMAREQNYRMRLAVTSWRRKAASVSGAFALDKEID